MNIGTELAFSAGFATDERRLPWKGAVELTWKYLQRGVSGNPGAERGLIHRMRKEVGYDY